MDYLVNDGFKLKGFELIERLMPNMIQKSGDESSTNQSRNLFNSDTNLTFKQLNLFPRVFLLLQES